jgi:hypothetical protein
MNIAAALGQRAQLGDAHAPLALKDLPSTTRHEAGRPLHPLLVTGMTP